MQSLAIGSSWAVEAGTMASMERLRYRWHLVGGLDVLILARNMLSNVFVDCLKSRTRSTCLYIDSDSVKWHRGCSYGSQ
jgi:hypothetical protein